MRTPLLKENAVTEVCATATVSEAKELEKLKAEWRELSSLDRSAHLNALVTQGVSRRELARKIGCSEGLVRKLLRLAQLTEEDTKSLREGALSCRQAVSRVRSTEIKERLRLLTLKKADWDQQVQRGVELMDEWLKELDLSASYREILLEEIRRGPYWIRRWEFEKEAPKPWQIPLDKDPLEVIRDSRPPGREFELVTDYINHCFVWYARWSQRVFPDRQLREEVLEIVLRRAR